MQNTGSDFQEVVMQILPQLVDYLKESQQGTIDVLQQMPASELAQQLQLDKWIRQGGLANSDMTDFVATYLTNSQHMHHPRYIGHQVASHHLSSGIADIIQGVINNPMAIYEMGPSAVVIEQTVINWMLEKAGWLHKDDITDFTENPQSGAGILTHGGSMANLTALLAARASIAPNSWETGTPSELVVMGPQVSHYSIARAISIMGLGSQAYLPVGVSSTEVMIPDMLPKVYQQAMDSGQQVMAVVANACATATGLYDPLEEIGHFCREHDLWYHVDGAHGASALLHDDTKHYLNGLQMADSMIWDTHKMLRTTTLCAAALFRKQESLATTFRQKGSYLFHDKEEPGFDLMPYTIECTKAAIGTKLYWVLATQGERAVANYVKQQYDITAQMHALISTESDFACPYLPQANILCFKYTDGPDSNDYQLTLRNEVVKRGKFYITSAEVKGIRYLRMTVINELTTLDDITALLQHIRVIAAELV